VRVLEVDLSRKRISLTMKLDAPVPSRGDRSHENTHRPAGRNERTGGGGHRSAAPAQPAGGSAMAAAFAKLKR